MTLSSISEDAIALIRKHLFSWGREHYRDYPWRSTGDPYEGLVAEILLQRTRVDAVVTVFTEFIRKYPDSATLSRSTVVDIERVIYPLGLKWRAPLLKKLGKTLDSQPDFDWSYASLLRLPGVGPYTAAAWVSFHGGGRGVLVDANIVRWVCRLIGYEYDGETRRKRWLRELTDRLTPSEFVREFNYAMLDFTMTICTIYQPRCAECPFADKICTFGRGSHTLES